MTTFEHKRYRNSGACARANHVLIRECESEIIIENL